MLLQLELSRQVADRLEQELLFVKVLSLDVLDLLLGLGNLRDVEQSY